ncbi:MULTISPECIES: arsenate reductase/protein-tyrosine-phosphatase family protein [unclassified Curtobacterium]|uniref:arsenate reductase/protein-tyrosine-phosphatase family protein n=1 Tax=unclassified Curtobacterium TaxID=257496 RepID=UPI00226B7EF6|nr:MULTISPECIES: hypothetical protein [unclassified Curtobacterium]
MTSSPRRILFVCEGNVCRSPYAAMAFQQQWRAVPSARQTVTASAGTRAPSGALAHEQLRTLGLEAAPLDVHRARSVDDVDLRQQDLVVTMERRHRQAVLERAPQLVRRTFTLGEVARIAEPLLAGGIDTATAHDEFHDLLARFRLAAPAPSSTGPSDDVPDPVRGDGADFRRMATRIDHDLDLLVTLLVRFDAVLADDTRNPGAGR